MELAAAAGLAALEAAAPAGSPKQRQKRSVSSAAALTTVVPSGLWARCSTREVCPVSSATFAMEGYFQRQSWFWLRSGRGVGGGGQAGWHPLSVRVCKQAGSALGKAGLSAMHGAAAPRT